VRSSKLYAKILPLPRVTCWDELRIVYFHPSSRAYHCLTLARSDVKQSRGLSRTKRAAQSARSMAITQENLARTTSPQWGYASASRKPSQDTRRYDYSTTFSSYTKATLRNASPSTHCARRKRVNFSGIMRLLDSDLDALKPAVFWGVPRVYTAKPSFIERVSHSVIKKKKGKRYLYLR